MSWLISLFATPQESEAILGDLEEERSQIAVRSGDAAARRWYWRQSLRTVAHLAASPFREAPLTMIGIGILGIALSFPLNWGASGVAGGIVSRIDVYPYVPAKLYWLLTSLAAPLALGFLGAWVLGKRAMSGAIAMVLAIITMVLVIDPFLMLFVFAPRPHPTYSLSFFATRAVVLLSMWGGITLLGAAMGVTLKRRISPRVASQG